MTRRTPVQLPASDLIGQWTSRAANELCLRQRRSDGSFRVSLPSVNDAVLKQTGAIWCHLVPSPEASLMTAIDSVAKAKEALNASASGEMQSVYSASLVQQPRMHQLAENLQKVLEGRGALAYSKMSNGDKMILTDFIKKPAAWCCLQCLQLTFLYFFSRKLQQTNINTQPNKLQSTKNWSTSPGAVREGCRWCLPSEIHGEIPGTLELVHRGNLAGHGRWLRWGPAERVGGRESQPELGMDID